MKGTIKKLAAGILFLVVAIAGTVAVAAWVTGGTGAVTQRRPPRRP